MQIEIGGTYTTGDGKTIKIKILRKDVWGDYYVGSDGNFYLKNGLRLLHQNKKELGLYPIKVELEDVL